MTVRLRAFRMEDEAPVVALWDAAGLLRPWNDPARDIRRKQAVQPELFLVAVEGETIVGSVMAGYDGHRGWMNYLAVSPARRGEGIGRRLVQAAEEGLAALGCPKVNVQVRHGNAEAPGFYERLGYSIDAAVSLGKRLERDDE